MPPVKLLGKLVLGATIGWIAIALPNSMGMTQSRSAATASNPLIGRWQTTQPILGMRDPLEFVFSEAGQALSLMREGQTLNGWVSNYSVDVKPKPMHLDWIVSDRVEKSLTIFEMMPDGKVKLQVEQVAPGKPRPQAFKNELVLDRISTEPSMKLDAQQLVAAERSTSGEGQLVIGSLVRSAMLQYATQNKLAATLTELDFRSDTANYRYELKSQSNGLRFIARPKRQGLKSYIAFLTRPYENDLRLRSIVCASVRPSLIAPAPIPSLSNGQFLLHYYAIQCGSGSEAVPF